MKKLLFAFFVFILPLAIFIDWNTCVEWSGKFSNAGSASQPALLFGFPFPDSGIFGYYNSLESTTHLGYFFLDQLIIYSVAFLIYYFLLRKINVQKFKIAIAVAVTIIYVTMGIQLLFGFYVRWKYQAGSWPEKVEIDKAHYRNTLTHLFRP